MPKASKTFHHWYQQSYDRFDAALHFSLFCASILPTAELELPIIESSEDILKTSNQEMAVLAVQSFSNVSHSSAAQIPVTDFQKLYFQQLKEIDELRYQIKKLDELTWQKEKLIKQNETYKKIVQKIFTENQIGLLSGLKKKVWWTNEEISNAFTLRYLSRGAYIYTSFKMQIPLPGLSTLRRWASTFNMKNGILEEIVNIMRICGTEKKPTEKLCVISFDEVKVNETVEYDQQFDEFVRPHKQMQHIKTDD